MLERGPSAALSRWWGLVACVSWVGLSGCSEVRETVSTEAKALPRESKRGGQGSAGDVSSSLPERARVEESSLVVGQEVLLQATHAQGVPLHPSLQSSKVSGRAPSGASAVILAIAEGGNWLEIEWSERAGAAKARGWIVRRYVQGATSPGATRKKSSALSPDSPWASKQACLSAMRSDAAKRKSREALRLGSYNVKWFPDGKPGKTPAPKGGVDVEWLACAIASLDLDALSVQEFKLLPHAQDKTRELLSGLNRYTGGKWQARFDDCPQPAVQHVGILWDSARLTAKDVHTRASLNPHGEACKNSLRPGLQVDFASSRGESFRFLSVHFKSGSDQRSLGLRDRSFEALSPLWKETMGPVVVAGDFNTMGCESCAPKLTGEAERKQRRAQLSADRASFLPEEESCSHYYGGNAHLLDGFAIVRPSGKLTSEMAGACESWACSTQSAERISQTQALSDHCPLVLTMGSR